MLSKSSCGRGLAAFALMACMAGAHAGLVVYTSEAAFLASVNGSAVDTMDDVPMDLVDSPLVRSVGSYGYTASADGGFYGVGSAADVWLSTNVALPILFDQFSGGVRAIGGYFFATDLSGGLLGGETMQVTATDLSGLMTETFVNADGNAFLGFVSSDAISNLQVGVLDTGSNNAWATVNNLVLAQAAAQAVPEPGSCVLALTALGLAGWTTRRRKEG